MVLPGTGFMLLWFGGMLLIGNFVLRSECRIWERGLYLAMGIIGLCLFRGITVLDKFGFLNG